MSEFQMMKDSPQELFQIYITMIQNGETLSDEQIVKLEYLKKILLKE